MFRAFRRAYFWIRESPLSRMRVQFVLLLSFFAALFISLVVFNNRQDIALHITQVLLVWALLLLLTKLPVLARYWRRALLVLASTGLALLFLWLAGPTILGDIVLPDYHLNLDHWPMPQPGRYNEDGIYPDIPAGNYHKKDFNIIMIGDSYTQGVYVGDEQTFAWLVGEMLREKYPDLPCRIINFGWGSSSPILQWRRLQLVGAKYKPDLVVQAFDMGDFEDDLVYDIDLQLKGEKQLSIFRALLVRFSMLLGVEDFSKWLKLQLPIQWRKKTEAEKLNESVNKQRELNDIPHYRYFALNQPLKKSRRYLETTWNAIVQTNAWAKRNGAESVLIVLPRYQQYNRNECPNDGENVPFPESDEYIYEPFKFFAEKAGEVSFPIHSLLDDFRNSVVFPTTWDHDGHYNIEGNRIAAQAIVRHLIADDLIPKR